MYVERMIGALRGDLELRIAGEAGLPFGLADGIGLIVKRVLTGLLELLLVGMAPERNRTVVEHPLLGRVDERTRVMRIVMPELLRDRRVRVRGKVELPINRHGSRVRRQQHACAVDLRIAQLVHLRVLACERFGHFDQREVGRTVSGVTHDPRAKAPCRHFAA